MEEKVVAAAEPMKEPATRSIGFVLLFVAILIFGANEFMLLIFNLYFPIILALSGPFITMGIIGIIHPLFLDSLFSSPEEGHPLWACRVSMTAFVLGILLGIFICLKLNFG